jgi:hypothetical protein
VCGIWPDTHIEGWISGLPTVAQNPPEGGKENQMKRLMATLAVLSVFLLVFAASLHAASSAELAQGNNSERS